MVGPIEEQEGDRQPDGTGRVARLELGDDRATGLLCPVGYPPDDPASEEKTAVFPTGYYALLCSLSQFGGRVPTTVMLRTAAPDAR